MIPKFPKFKKIDIEDKKNIESHTCKFSPYSDFNFTSLWSWDTNRERMVSELNGNLVVLFTDYETHETFLSFLGTNEVEQTVHELINFAKKSGISPVLRLVPEESLKGLQNSDLLLEEDRDNFDYIISVTNLVGFKGIKYKGKRHLVSKFLREHPDISFEFKTLKDSTVRENIISVLNDWKDKKRLDRKVYDSENEERAIIKLLETGGDNIIISWVMLRDLTIGFSIDEILPSKYAISHFFKADISHGGVYDFLNEKVSEYLVAHNVELWNWEQDLGVSNLRRSKMSYYPSTFLKKYKISLTKR